MKFHRIFSKTCFCSTRHLIYLIFYLILITVSVDLRHTNDITLKQEVVCNIIEAYPSGCWMKYHKNLFLCKLNLLKSKSKYLYLICYILTMHLLMSTKLTFFSFIIKCKWLLSNEKILSASRLQMS